MYKKEEFTMKRRQVMAVAAGSALILGLLTGCGGGQSKTETAAQTTTVETAADTETALENGSETEAAGEMAELPAFEYNGDDPYMGTICNWMAEAFGGYFDENAVMIPAPEILYTDDSDPEKVRIWGDFWVYGYALENDTLMTVSGGSNPGLLYLAKEGDSYMVTDFDAVGDGSQYTEDIERICSEAPEEAGDLAAAFSEESDDAVRKELIRMYEAQNSLGIKAYQDYGWDPVPLE